MEASSPSRACHSAPNSSINKVGRREEGAMRGEEKKESVMEEGKMRWDKTIQL